MRYARTRCECTMRVALKCWTWPWHFFNMSVCTLRYAQHQGNDGQRKKNPTSYIFANRLWHKLIHHTQSAVETTNETHTKNVIFFSFINILCAFSSFAVMPPHCLWLCEIQHLFLHFCILKHSMLSSLYVPLNRSKKEAIYAEN